LLKELKLPKEMVKEIIYHNYQEVMFIGENLNGMKFSKTRPLNLDKREEQELEYLYAETIIL
jgi:hypothetical protein